MPDPCLDFAATSCRGAGPARRPQKIIAGELSPATRRQLSMFCFSPIARGKRTCSTPSKASRWPTKNSPPKNLPLQFRLLWSALRHPRRRKRNSSEMIQGTRGCKTPWKSWLCFRANEDPALREADLFLFSDALPWRKPARSLIEAMAFGLPTSRRAGVRARNAAGELSRPR